MGRLKILFFFLSLAHGCAFIDVTQPRFQNPKLFLMAFIEMSLRRNPPDVGVTSGQNPCTKTIYIVLQTSVGLF